MTGGSVRRVVARTGLLLAAAALAAAAYGYALAPVWIWAAAASRGHAGDARLAHDGLGWNGSVKTPRVVFRTPRLTLDRAGIAVEAGTAEAGLALAWPPRLELDLAGGVAVRAAAPGPGDSADTTVAADADTARLSVEFAPDFTVTGLYGAINEARWHGGPSFDGAAGPGEPEYRASLTEARFDLARDGGRIAIRRLAVAVHALALGRDPVPALGPVIAHGRIDVEATPPLTRDRGEENSSADARTAWRDAGGRITVHDLWLNWGAVRLTATGGFALDGANRPAGTLDATLSGFPTLIDILVARRQMSPGEGNLARVVLGMLARRNGEGRPELAAPIEARDGRLFLGPVKIAALKPLG